MYLRYVFGLLQTWKQYIKWVRAIGILKVTFEVSRTKSCGLFYYQMVTWLPSECRRSAIAYGSDNFAQNPWKKTVMRAIMRGKTIEDEDEDEDEGNENLLSHSHRNNGPSSLFVQGSSILSRHLLLKSKYCSRHVLVWKRPSLILMTTKIPWKRRLRLIWKAATETLFAFPICVHVEGSS